MKTYFAFVLSVFVIISSISLFAQEAESDTSQGIVPFKVIAQEFTSTLQGILMSELKKGGPEAAVAVCSDTAQKLTAVIGEKYNVEIRRISLKYRNPKNAPRNDEEINLLKKMESEQSNASNPADEPAIKKFKSEEKMNRDKRFFTAPIKIGAPCLQCHGGEDQINLETLRKINSVYPNDKARGYKSGDFRGAVVIERK